VTNYTLCAQDELGIGESRQFKAGDRKVLIYRLEDGFYATQHNCTHVFAPLARGKIVEGCQIQCPFHRARFDIRTGEVREWANFPPGVQLLNAVRGEKALKTYPVTVVDGNVCVEVD
jgi:3-phenylpropionate/trans-cinnamate dioxygenase ferredoxin subunit